MATGTYSYNPADLKGNTMSRMRFELGDTMVQGAENTCAVTDEEINAAIEMYPKSWKKAKLMLVESIYRRFSYEVDTKTGPLSLSLHERAETWKEAYEALKKEVKAENISVPAFAGNAGKKPPYFLQVCRRMKGRGRDDKCKHDVFKTWQPFQRICD